MNQILSKGKKFLFSAQSSVLSAATIIMFMIIASRILGLVRQRVLAHFFAPSELALFFAAFRLPDTIFEVLVFGTFSSAFIPVFTKSLKKGRRKAWQIAESVTNIGLILFALFALVIILLSSHLYGFIAPGFGSGEREKIVEIVNILIIGQGFFVISYVLTGVLESLRRFLVPALAPLFYNLGIILGTAILGPKMGLMGPAIGVLIGSASHFLIQFFF
jgi:putative peptidoglycan lipid II flippase